MAAPEHPKSYIWEEEVAPEGLRLNIHLADDRFFKWSAATRSVCRGCVSEFEGRMEMLVLLGVAATTLLVVFAGRLLPSSKETFSFWNREPH